MRSFIITSTGRTGTRMLADYIAGLPVSAEVHHNSRHTALVNCITNLCIDRLAPRGVLRWSLKVLKGPELHACEAGIYVDSNNHLFGAVSLAPEIYPGLQVAHIVRDPRDYVRSHINWAYSRRKSFVANFLLPFWQPNGWLAREIPLSLWLRMDRLERFCWIWNFKNRTIEQAAVEGVPYARFRLEDLLQPATSESGLHALAEFAGFDGATAERLEPPSRVNQSVATRVPAWPDWPDWHCAALDRWCGALMTRYDYGSEPLWTEKVERGRSAISARYARLA